MSLYKRFKPLKKLYLSIRIKVIIQVDNTINEYSHNISPREHLQESKRRSKTFL